MPPFNVPAMIPLWMFPVALVSGTAASVLYVFTPELPHTSSENTYGMKPSERDESVTRRDIGPLISPEHKKKVCVSMLARLQADQKFHSLTGRGADSICSG